MNNKKSLRAALVKNGYHMGCTASKTKQMKAWSITGQVEVIDDLIIRECSCDAYRLCDRL